MRSLTVNVSAVALGGALMSKTELRRSRGGRPARNARGSRVRGTGHTFGWS